MRACVLLILALFGQSGAKLKDIIEKSSKTASSLNPTVYDREPGLSGKGVMAGSLLTPTVLEEQPSTPFVFGDNVNLGWLAWNQSLPDGAVAVYNGYTERTDYVCKHQCEAGFYRPSLGPYCHYPYADRGYRAADFQVLVNKDNFEFLEWKEDSYGSVPKDSVRTCSGVDIFVGKNKYGLGKVVSLHEAFFLPWEGDEYWYKKYQVLSINRDAYSQHISHVVYALNDAQIFQHPPETMRISGVTNNDCQTVTKTVTISKSTETETTWNIGRGTMLGVKGSITAKIPLLGSGGIELGGEKTLQFDRGTSVTEAISHSVSVELSVPPNHSCRVRMEGRKFTADIPYTARLSRTYQGGETQWTSVSGTYDGVQIGEVRAVVDRCEAVVDAKPCP
ncbi:natterin-3 [Gadus morhua]|uniref:Natterin-3-like n=1 Tax=Gadus morhua TaxID=8049 RepID=A0A8C4ZBT6_GADMO|nr:natterin-3-like [Gadus morhua]